MAGTFKFELVTPERMVLSQDAAQVVVPGVEGEFTVLAGHAPVIAGLRPGVVDATLADDRTMRVFVKGGFAEVDADRLIVLAERASDVADLDIAAERRPPKPSLPPQPATPPASPPTPPSSACAPCSGHRSG
jgi:F-type H+-transporting ATPase subunit epsilon